MYLHIAPSTQTETTGSLYASTANSANAAHSAQTKQQYNYKKKIFICAINCRAWDLENTSWSYQNTSIKKLSIVASRSISTQSDQEKSTHMSNYYGQAVVVLCNNRVESMSKTFLVCGLWSVTFSGGSIILGSSTAIS